MRKMYSKLAVVAISGLLLASCGTSNSVVSGHLISKRKVNKGFFLNNSKKANGPDADGQEARHPFIQYSEEKQTQAFQETKEVNNAAFSDGVSDNVPAENTFFALEKTQTPGAENHTPAKTGKAATVKQNKEERNQIKAEFRQAKKEFKKAAKKTDSDQLLLVILCFILPPVAVYLYEGGWNSRCWLNLLLTLLCGIPGVIHALIVVLKD